MRTLYAVMCLADTILVAALGGAVIYVLVRFCVGEG